MNAESIDQNAVASITFTVSDGSDSLRSLSVTVVRPLHNVTVDLLHPSMLPRRKFLVLGQDVCDQLGTNDAFYVSISKLLEPIRHGLLLRIPAFARAYELLDAQTNLLDKDDGPKFKTHSLHSRDKTNCESTATTLTIEDEDMEEQAMGSQIGSDSPILLGSVAETLTAWGAKELVSIPTDDEVPKISMKRPRTSQRSLPLPPPRKTLQYNISPQNEQTPRDFIISRYYNTLYSLTTPLSYFPKTALNRLRNMHKDDRTGLKDALESVLLSTEQLNHRQREKLGLSKFVGGALSSLFLLAFEQENQEIFASRNYDELNKDSSFENLVLNLKIREAQLQILVIAEMLICMEVDENIFISINESIKETPIKRKRSLVRTQKKKRLIPTLLGLGMEDADNSTGSTQDDKKTNLLTLYRLLLSLIDQLGIWGVFQGKSSEKEDDHNYGFLAYVLVPYYNKTLPVIVQFIIKSFKNIQPSFKVPKKSASRQPSVSEPEEASNSEHSNKRKSKFLKTHLSSNKLPFLKRTSTTIESSDLRQPILLKRSKSSLSAKNMQKRQVDMLGSKAELNTDQEDSELKSQPLFLFCDARKVKSVTMSTSSTVEIAQVEATPTKPSMNSGNSINSSSFVDTAGSAKEKKDLPQVFATPSNVRVVAYDLNNDYSAEEYNRNEGNGSSRKQTMLEKLTGVVVDSSPVTAFSTPFRKNSTDTNVFLNTPEDVIIKSSPEKVISSPIKRSTKPGEPITITSSPVFVANLSGSPRNLITKKVTKPKDGVNVKGAALSKEVALEEEVAASKEDIASKQISSSNTKQAKPKSKSISSRPTKKRVKPNLGYDCKAVPHPALSVAFDNLKIFQDPPLSQTSASVEEPREVLPAQPFNFDIMDTDLDSDLEKLMSAPKPPIKKYLRKK